MGLQIHTLDGGVRAIRDSSGVRIETAAKIEGLDGAAEQKVLRALEHPDLPRFGAPYPGRGDLQLLEVSAELVDGDNAALRLVYRTPSTGENSDGAPTDQIISVEIDSTTTTETTRTDGAGILMVNRYRGFPILAGQVAGSLYTVNKVVETQVLRPQMSVRIVQERRAQPLSLARRFVGTVNADTWSGDPAMTWLCTGISSSKQGAGWRTTFQFAYRAETWRVLDTVEVAGQLPEDAVDGNGIMSFDVYKAELWRDLGVQL